MFEPLLSPLFSSLFSSLIAAAQRIFITADPVLETHFTLENTKTLTGNFRVGALCVLPTSATTVTLFGQLASASNYFKVLSTGFASISIGGSIVTSTVAATKGSKFIVYDVVLSGNDFIFQENGITIDTVTDAGAAANSLVIDVLCQSNGADFFDGIYADPKITDITTPSNSESWKINRAFPATTEQSSSGNNILTYVNAPDSTRELFTFNQNDNGWDGSVERIENGGFDTGASWSTGVGWTISGGLARADLSSGFINLSQSSVQTPGEIFKTMFKIVNYVAGDLAINLGGGVNGTQRSSNGTFTEILPPAESNFFKFFNVAATTELDVDEVSIKRFLPVA